MKPTSGAFTMPRLSQACLLSYTPSPQHAFQGDAAHQVQRRTWLTPNDSSGTWYTRRGYRSRWTLRPFHRTVFTAHTWSALPKNVLLVNALLLILFLSATYGGRTHDKPIADATPYSLPAGSRLLQALGFLAFMLPEVTILMPTKKPRGQELTREQQRANQALNQRRLCIEHVNS